MATQKYSQRRGRKHGEAMLSMDLYAYHSKINSWNPSFKIFLAILFLVVCLWANNLWVSATVIFLSAYITVGLGKMPAKEYVKLLSIPIGFLMAGSIIIAFELADAERGIAGLWLPFGYVYCSEESISTVLNLWGKAFGGMSAMFMMSLSTPSHEIFSVLKRLKIPSVVIELMHMIYRFVFVMIDTFQRMNNSAQSRMGYVDWRTSLQTFGSIAGNLLVVSLKKAGHYYDAMESRCYDGELVFLETEKKLEKNQLLYGCGMTGLLFAVCFFTLPG